MQLGAIEYYLISELNNTDNLIIRAGRSHIINMRFVNRIDITNGKLTLSDCISFSKDIQLSKEALIKIEKIIESLKL